MSILRLSRSLERIALVDGLQFLFRVFELLASGGKLILQSHDLLVSLLQRSLNRLSLRQQVVVVQNASCRVGFNKAFFTPNAIPHPIDDRRSGETVES